MNDDIDLNEVMEFLDCRFDELQKPGDGIMNFTTAQELKFGHNWAVAQIATHYNVSLERAKQIAMAINWY